MASVQSFVVRAVLLAAALALMSMSAAASSANLQVTPKPGHVEARPGAPFQVRDGQSIIYPLGDLAAAGTARWLAQLTLRSRGLRLQPAARSPSRVGIIVLRRIAGPRGSEAYGLDITHERVVIEASGDAGLMYGAVTLWQLMTADQPRGAVRIASLRIDDKPRFGWRGLLLDSARHMQSAAYIERLIDWMALHKLNVLQWHLTDDQGWRIPIIGYPRLTSVGAWRVPASIGPPPRDRRTGRPQRYGGFYSRVEIRAIVAHGLARNVTVVPEIEMPSHALSAALAYPELSAGRVPPASMQSDWGLIPAAYGLDEHVFAFLDTVLGQVMDLFPSRFIAVGGDEAPLQLWRSMPGVQARMKALGIDDGPGLESYFMRRIAEYLAKRGRRMVGWDEILQGGALKTDAVVTSWQGALSAQAAARRGHDVVMAIAPTLYFDNRQSDLANEPPGRGWVVSLGDVYALDPDSPPFPPKPPGAPATTPPPDPFTDSEKAHFLGVQGNLWTEHIRTEARLSAMAFPRAAAVAEVGWTPKGERDWNDFLGRMPAEFARFASLGLGEDQSALAVRVALEPQADGAGVTLSSQTGAGQIRYRLDGGDPDAGATLYQTAFHAPIGARLSTAAFIGAQRISPIARVTLTRERINTRRSQELELCPGTLPLNLEGPPDPGGRRTAFLVQIMKPCWVWRKVDLARGVSIDIAAVASPDNLQLGADAAKVVRFPTTASGGAFEVRLGSCDAGPILATLPLPGEAARSRLDFKLPPQVGTHDLCFVHATASERDPLWGIDTVEVTQGSGAPGHD